MWISDYVFTEHALDQVRRRQLQLDEVRRVLRRPEQAFEVRPGRWVFQSRVAGHGSQPWVLMRVFVDVDREPAEVVTVYRTSKVGKYWRRSG